MKQFTKFAVLMFACTFAVLSSCNQEDENLDEIVVNVTQPTATVPEENVEGLIVVNGTITGVVKDGISNDVLEGVTVSVSGNAAATATTDANGGYSISGLTTGEYILTFVKEGYANYVSGVDIPRYSDIANYETVSNGTSLDYFDTLEGYLQPLTSTVNGYAFFYDNKYPAEDVTVTLRYNQFITPSFFTAKVDEDGFFEFKNVPAFLNNQAYFNFPGYDFENYISGDYFNSWVSVATPHNNVTKLGTFELTRQTYNGYDIEVVETSMMVNYGDYMNLAPNNPFTFTLNQNIDFEKSFFNMYLLDDSGNEILPIKASFAPTKALQAIEVTPAAPLYIYETYSIEGVVTTTSGEIAYLDFEFDVFPPIDIYSANVLMTRPFSLTDLDLTSYENFTNYIDHATDIIDIAIDRSFTFEFSLPIDEEFNALQEGYIKLVELLDGNRIAEVDINTVIDGTKVTITPAANLKPGANYIIAYSFYAEYLEVYDYDPFYATYINTQDIIEFSTEEVTPAVTDAPALRLTNPDMTINDSTITIPVTITSVNNATGYEISAKDNHNNTQWNYVTYILGPDELSDFEDGDVAGIDRKLTFKLPPEFDYFYDDDLQTPFSHGTEVYIKVIAYSYDTFTESDSIVLKDNTPLSSADVTDTYAMLNAEGTAISANNTSGNDTTVYFGFRFNDSYYVDETFVPADADVAVYNGASATSLFVESMPAKFTWEVRNNLWYARVAVTLPASTNATSYQLRITGIKDASGISMTDVIGLTFN